MSRTGWFSRILAMALVLGAASGAFAADEGVWSVSKSSGEVWMTTTGAQQVSLKQEEVLKPGDTIRTGRNGRVLLVRGEETILVSPNSVIGLPAETKEGLSTTIVQQAGSILLEVEKRNVKHFEVETPYLAAVVKGTQFRVSVNAASTSVDVLRGQVEVADYKSGQIAQVMPGQVATAFAQGKPGLSLSGSGTLNPIEQGKPRASTIDRIPVPKTGLSAPRHAASGQSIRALGHLAASPHATPALRAVTMPGVTRISASLGEVRLNFQKVTHGLARGSGPVPGSSRSAAHKDTVWAARDSGATMGVGNSSGNSGDASSGNTTTSASTTAASGVTPQVAAVTAPANNSAASNANGTGNGFANANANGSGSGSGNGNGNNNNSGNGNRDDDDNRHNHGHGHGHGHGH
jgi:hypothetical protein